jgi:hypothetical protein
MSLNVITNTIKSGVKFVNESCSIGVKCNLFRYSVIVAVTAENPFKYAEEKGSRSFNETYT